jgi:hypothetical protein
MDRSTGNRQRDSLLTHAASPCVTSRVHESRRASPQPLPHVPNSHPPRYSVNHSLTISMSKLRSFRALLQGNIDPDETSWVYHVANLPRFHQTNAAGLVKCLSVTSSDAKQEISLRFESAPSNRVMPTEPLDKFLLISLADFRLRWPAKSPEHPPRLATGRENGDYVTRLLTTGIKLNGTHYHFFGHSNSQLKSRSCFMLAASKEDISAKIEDMGDLSKLKSVGKKAKRIGLLFSSAEMALALPPDRCEDIEDVKRDDYIFTDGCGLISSHLARNLVQRRNIIFRDKRYLPSVFQIRYRGYKGVLTLDPSLQRQVQVQFRESMRKFKDATDHSFAVVDYSKVGSSLDCISARLTLKSLML